MSQPQTIFVLNLGPTNLVIRSVILGGANPTDFIVDNHCIGVTLRQAEYCTVEAKFAPAALNLRQAKLIITSNAANNSQLLSLSGTGVERPAPPDLVVVSLEAAGPVAVNKKSQAEAPIRVVVRNQGQSPAAIFKLATEYSDVVISSASTTVVPFTAQSTADVDPVNGVYPFTRQPLLPNKEVVFTGYVTFDPAERGITISLQAVADSCRGEEAGPDCRVAESNETNNISAPLLLDLPPTYTPTPTLTPTPTHEPPPIN